MMTSDIKQLSEMYPDLINYHSLGQTQNGRDLWAVSLGHGNATIFINGSHHAREWITTNLNMKMIQQYAHSYTQNEPYHDYNVREILNNATIWFVPMVNPDGVTLQQSGIKALPENVHNQVLQMNDGSYNFTRWKSNASGVDLNRNYPVLWNRIPGNSSEPSWAFHKGNEPLSEIETQLISEFTYKIDPELAIAYHTTGRVVYWLYNHDSNQYERDKKIAHTIRDYTGYSIIPPQLRPNGGTYSNWFIQEFKRPAFTIELNPPLYNRHVPVENFPTIWDRNKLVPLYAAQQSYDMWMNRNPIQQVNRTAYLFEETPLYKEPNSVKTKNTISQQMINITARQGEWLKVHTLLGEMWIHEPNILPFPKLNMKDIFSFDFQVNDKNKTVNLASSNLSQLSLFWAFHTLPKILMP